MQVQRLLEDRGRFFDLVLIDSDSIMYDTVDENVLNRWAIRSAHFRYLQYLAMKHNFAIITTAQTRRRYYGESSITSVMGPASLSYISSYIIRCQANPHGRRYVGMDLEFYKNRYFLPGTKHTLVFDSRNTTLKEV